MYLYIRVVSFRLWKHFLGYCWSLERSFSLLYNAWLNPSTGERVPHTERLWSCCGNDPLWNFNDRLHWCVWGPTVLQTLARWVSTNSSIQAVTHMWNIATVLVREFKDYVILTGPTQFYCLMDMISIVDTWTLLILFLKTGTSINNCDDGGRGPMGVMESGGQMCGVHGGDLIWWRGMVVGWVWETQQEESSVLSVSSRRSTRF